MHYMTDLVPGFRNYKRWEPLVEIGNTLSGLTLMMAPGKIDADSYPELIGKVEEPQAEMQF